MKSEHTKFILHGGFASGNETEDNSAFYEEILKSAPDNARVLLVTFAKDDEQRIGRAILKVSREFDGAKGTKHIAIYVANRDYFIEQVKESDIIYFHGGVSIRLLDTLMQYPELKSALQGKIVAGESAGANVWCKFFYSPKTDSVNEGLGYLPIKIIPHYKQEYREKLGAIDQDLELLLLPEYEFKVFEY